jgi:hypothetical protein
LLVLIDAAGQEVTEMSLRHRIGFDAGGTRLEDALQWAATHHLHYVDFNADTGANYLAAWSDERIRSVRESLCSK